GTGDNGDGSIDVHGGAFNQGIKPLEYDVRHIQGCAKPRKRQALDQGWVGSNSFSTASRSPSESPGSSTARASINAPTIVATMTMARSCAAGCPQSGDWRATRSIISLIRRVAARLTSGAWRGI